VRELNGKEAGVSDGEDEDNNLDSWTLFLFLYKQDSNMRTQGTHLTARAGQAQGGGPRQLAMRSWPVEQRAVDTELRRITPQKSRPIHLPVPVLGDALARAQRFSERKEKKKTNQQLLTLRLSVV
jgi:hypothetical protein